MVHMLLDHVACSLLRARIRRACCSTIWRTARFHIASQALGAERFVLDLRGNGGGVLDGALGIAGLFLNKPLVSGHHLPSTSLNERFRSHVRTQAGIVRNRRQQLDAAALLSRDAQMDTAAASAQRG